eukprot:gene29264-2348_t
MWWSGMDVLDILFYGREHGYNRMFLLLCLGLLPSTAAGPTYDPVASAGATVTFGDARFTVLTNALVRMELVDSKKQWQSGQNDNNNSPSFEDRPTL